MIQYGTNSIGPNSQIFEPVTLGFPSRENLSKTHFLGAIIGKNALIRSGTILYCDVVIGDDFQTGHNVVIREKTTIHDRVAVGTGSIIEGYSSIGSDVNIQSMVFIPTNTQIGDHVFLGPNVILTNDRYPPRRIGGLNGPVIKDGVAVGANTTILPGICIGEGALVAAGSIVTHDVPDHMLAIGSPARIKQLPKTILPR